MNRNTAMHYLALIFYFSCLQTGVFGLTADPVFAKSDAPDKRIAESVFEQPLSSPEAKTVLNIPDIKVREVALFGTKENPVAQRKPLSERTFAWFWDKDDGSEETPKPEVDESSGQKTTSETPEKEIIEKKENTAEELPWWKPEAYEVIEEDTPSEVVPENKKMAVPPVEPMEKPATEAKPEMKMKEAVPAIPPVVEPEAMEIPEPTIVPEVVPENKKMAVPPVEPVEKPATEAKPEMKMKEAVPEVKVTSTGFFKGAKVCEECHEGEYRIWKKTKHHTSFRTVHREPKDSAKPSPKKILKNVAGAKRMKRNKTCYLCHYTLEKKDADAKPVAKSGTSCESCHGASSDYLAIHDNYGGEGVKRADETPEHKKERIEKSAAAGLIWPIHKYQVVENCMTCHGLAHPDLSGDVLAKMLGAGHPINPDFEAVKYSQGTVRHRYTPEDINNNREMTEPEKAELFVIGHAAALVSAKEAISKSSEPKYVDAQNKRAKNAEAVLSLLTDIPEAAQLIAEPNRSNALKLVNALAGKDLAGKVGSMLPKKSDYK